MTIQLVLTGSRCILTLENRCWLWGEKVKAEHGYHDHEESLVRVGVAYDFHLGPVDVAPTFNVDIVDESEAYCSRCCNFYLLLTHINTSDTPTLPLVSWGSSVSGKHKYIKYSAKTEFLAVAAIPFAKL